MNNKSNGEQKTDFDNPLINKHKTDLEPEDTGTVKIGKISVFAETEIDSMELVSVTCIEPQKNYTEAASL